MELRAVFNCSANGSTNLRVLWLGRESGSKVPLPDSPRWESQLEVYVCVECGRLVCRLARADLTDAARHCTPS